MSLHYKGMIASGFCVALELRPRDERICVVLLWLKILVWDLITVTDYYFVNLMR